MRRFKRVPSVRVRHARLPVEVYKLPIALGGSWAFQAAQPVGVISDGYDTFDEACEAGIATAAEHHFKAQLLRVEIDGSVTPVG